MAGAQAATPPATPDGPEPEAMAALLDRDAAPEARDRAMQQLVASAQAGDGHAAFYLGALYRSGMDHPARRVERDVETARFWLEKCVASQRCPLVALASLAELETFTRQRFGPYAGYVQQYLFHHARVSKTLPAS